MSNAFSAVLFGGVALFLSPIFSLGDEPAPAFRQLVAAFEAGNNDLQFAALEEAWKALVAEKKASLWPEWALINVARAEKQLRAGAPKDAAKSLCVAADLVLEHKGRLAYLTKSPELFFPRLAELHVGIAVANGEDPLGERRTAGYSFRQEGEEYWVVRAELYPEVKGFDVQVDEAEALVQILKFGRAEGGVFLKKREWRIGPKGDLVEDTLAKSHEVTMP